jgi:O-antigen/teichoic acid export membrane protein
MSIGKKLISNTTYLFLDWLSSALLSFIFWLIVWKTLDPVDWGIIGTSSNFIALLSSFLLAGLPFAISKLIPYYINSKKRKQANALVRFSLKVILITTTIFTLVAAIFHSSISSFLKIPDDAFILTAASIVFVSYGNILGFVQYGFQEMKKFFLTDVANFIMKTIGTILLVFVGIKYLGPMIGITFGFLATFLLRLSPKYLRDGKNSKVDYKEIWKYAAPAYISGASWALIIYSQFILLTVLGGSLAVTGVFTVPSTLSNLLGVFATVLTTAAFPVISGLFGRKAKRRQSKIISLIFRYTLLVVVPIGVLLMLFPQYAILLISKQSSLSGTSYFPILVPAALLYGLGYILHTNLYAIGKPHLQRNLVLATTGIFLGLSLLLIWKFSGIGLAVSYLTSMLFLFISSLYYVRKCLNFRTMDSLKIIAASICIGALLYAVKSLIGSIIVLAAVLLPSTLIYLGVLFAMRFYRSEDISILNTIAEKVPAIRRYILFVTKRIERKVIKE